jgi:hypothetical protein
MEEYSRTNKTEEQQRNTYVTFQTMLVVVRRNIHNQFTATNPAASVHCNLSQDTEEYLANLECLVKSVLTPTKTPNSDKNGYWVNSDTHVGDFSKDNKKMTLEDCSPDDIFEEVGVTQDEEIIPCSQTSNYSIVTSIREPLDVDSNN